MKACLLFLFAALCGSSALAASFDCNAASHGLERLICSDPRLSALDKTLADRYAHALAALDTPAARTRFVAEQRTWLKTSRGLCDDVACLLRAYDTRIRIIDDCMGICTSALENYRSAGEDHNLVTEADSNWRNASFNKDLLRHGLAPVTGCETLVDVAVGTAHGNHSYGGLCRPRDEPGFVMVCNDEMIGHFQLAPASSATTRYQLADFVIAHCFGG